jgi:hypothetical protein
MKKYFYSLLHKYLSTYILAHNTLIEFQSINNPAISHFSNDNVTYRDYNVDHKFKEISNNLSSNITIESPPDFLLISGLIHYERDIENLFESLFKMCDNNTRLIITYYSSLWRPLFNLASKLGLRQKLPESNWLSHFDVDNILNLQNFELISIQQKIIFPIYIPLISNFLNQYIAPLPFFNFFCILNIAIARPLTNNNYLLNQSVSIVIPSRNESENIRKIINRIPKMGENDEIIFIEGGSSDDTWNVIQQMHDLYGVNKRILIAQQKGIGKGDAVREGFKLASNEILMILDADMTVAPEDLSKFYDAIRRGKGEFINGSRLVYPMENGAMQFLNLIANKFFAMSFAFVLGQHFKDTLCGTKAISRVNYLKLSSNRSFFGDFDPFGDFDLIFGSARMGLKIIEVPIIYRERVYGKTNISRWKHGAILLYMLFFSAKRIKFI